MEKHLVSTAAFMVPNGGGNVMATDQKTGEILWTVGLEGGVHNAKIFLPYMGATDRLEWSKEVMAFQRGGAKASRIGFGKGAMESGANPDFQPASGEKLMKEMVSKIAKLNKKVNAAANEKRLATQTRLKEDREKREAIEAQERADTAAADKAAREAAEAERLASEGAVEVIE